MSDLIHLGHDEDGFGLDLPAALLRHPVHIMGVPGMGKSVFCGNLALKLHAGGEGVLVIDIKDGELAREVARRAPERGLITIAPGVQSGIGLNLLDGPAPIVVDAVLDLLERTGKADLTYMTRIRQYLTQALWLALATPGSTLGDVGRILTDRQARDRFLASPQVSERVAEFWAEFNALSAKAQHDLTESTVSRLDELLVPDILGAMLRRPTTLMLERWLDDGKMVVVDLVAGVPPRLTKLLGNVLMALVVTRALARPVQPGNRVWRIVSDEFDVLAAEPFVTAVDKLRAARVVAVMSHQNLSQLPPSLANSLSGVPIHAFFRISRQDQASLSRLLGPARARQLVELPKHTCCLDLREDEEGQPAWVLLEPEGWGPALRTTSLHDAGEADGQREAKPDDVIGEEITPAADLPRPGVGENLSAGADSALAGDAPGAGRAPDADQYPDGRAPVRRAVWSRRPGAV